MHPNLTPRDIERFWSKTDRSGGPDACWLWHGTISRFGYGRFSLNRRDWRAHRFSWVLANGQIADGLCVCHNCPNGDNPLCVNPAHLFLGSRAENRLDCVAKGRQAKGHTHGSRTKPDRVPRGERSGPHMKPERMARGDRHGNAKVTYEAVRAIRAAYATGQRSQQSLAHEFGISQHNVSRIVRRVIWRDD